jgi:hypothetical protein
MEQSAATLTELGIAPLMTDGIVARQRELGEIGRREAVRTAKTGSPAALLAAINAAMKSRS